nr:Arm DNA-binding domain-containing protein [Enterococcus faecalis]
MAMIKQYQKKNGEKAWYFKTYLGIDPITGKKRYTTKRGFRTQKEAKIALSRLELEIEKTGFLLRKKKFLLSKKFMVSGTNNTKIPSKKAHCLYKEMRLKNIFCQNLDRSH